MFQKGLNLFKKPRKTKDPKQPVPLSFLNHDESKKSRQDKLDKDTGDYFSPLISGEKLGQDMNTQPKGKNYRKF